MGCGASQGKPEADKPDKDKANLVNLPADDISLPPVEVVVVAVAALPLPPPAAARFAEWPMTLPSVAILLDDDPAVEELTTMMGGVVDLASSLESAPGQTPYGVGTLMDTISRVMSAVQSRGIVDGHCKTLALESYMVLQLFHGLKTNDPQTFAKCDMKEPADLGEGLHMDAMDQAMQDALAKLGDCETPLDVRNALYSGPGGPEFRSAIDDLSHARCMFCRYLVGPNVGLNPSAKDGVDMLQQQIAYMLGTDRRFKKFRAPVSGIDQVTTVEDVPQCMGFVPRPPLEGAPCWCDKPCRRRFQAAIGSYFYVCGYHNKLGLEELPFSL